MTNVIPFTPRGSAGGGWTASERARLAELAERLSAAEGVKVEVVYGVSDEGDPWCAIKDENEEILVHVARIDGQFVIHDAAADAVQEGDSLYTACDRLLGDAWRDPREEVVVPLTVRQAQSVIALALAVAFIHEVEQAEAATQAEAHPSVEAAAMVALTLPVIEPGSGEEPRHELLAAQTHEDTTTRTAALVEEAQAEERGEAPQPTTEEDARAEALDQDGAVDSIDDLLSAIRLADTEDEDTVNHTSGTAGDDSIQGGDGRDEIFGGDGNDSLNGGLGTDTLHGGSGADTLDGGGAEPGQFDLLDGGDGDDMIMLSGDSFAFGGRGADAFVITGRAAPDATLGIILDFSTDEGDHLLYVNGNRAVETARTELVNATDVPGFGPNTNGGGGNAGNGFTGFQVWVDLNGDGIADGHIYLGRPGANGAPPAPTDGANSENHPLHSQLPDGYVLLA